VKSLARSEREATACLIAHLAELDARRLYLGAGFSSLFNYCCEVLQLSEPAAYNRIEAARAARRFPVVLEMLGEGSLTLATVRLLASHLTNENHQELFAAAAGQSKRGVEELLVRYFPRPDVPASIRKLPTPKAFAGPFDAMLPSPSDATLPSPSDALPPPSDPPAAGPSVASLPLARASAPALPAPARRPVVSPLAPDRYEIRFTASAQTRDKLRQAQDLLRHAVPTGDLAEVFDRALTALLADLARKKFAATERPRASRGTAPGSRDVAARVRRAAGLRDRGACAFVSKSGRRCNGTAFLEFHHIEPYGVGGEATVDNIELRCAAHNRYEGELFYGHGRRAERRTLPGKSSSPSPGAPFQLGSDLRDTWP
jgi:hypothetical protein